MTHSSQTTPIAPGNWLGMVGGGQLGRMFCHAAQSMGYKVAVLDPAEGCPAGVAADLHIVAAYDDEKALDRLAQLCAAVTTEFENVPAGSLARLAAGTRVSPAARCVSIAQDRIDEKAFLSGAGIPVAPHAAILKPADLDRADDALFPGILKSARLGYDGKGQVRLASRGEALAAWQALGGVPCVLEALVPLASEISVVVARDVHGAAVAYTPSVNEHRDGILAISTVAPAADAAAAALNESAARIAQDVAHALEYVGVMCVEFFVLSDESLIANEMAPRPHNSGHYTIDACVVSQFEQQVRAMAGQPLGDPSCLCASVMLNVLGDIWFDPQGNQREPDWSSVLRVPGAKLHLYGKAEARAGRKMGHVTVLGATLEAARHDAKLVAAALGIQF
ncbi:MAG TPA: 5-(carboxyamino)imidazole ribonucleotide synthase [Pusillimonas sp.]|uniref:5-(carboxyamino)imidazole ribonucleotide synthase n=1 Tax=Pusillimonas sp. TaxID=3040095 RepID=UPI002BE13606|nr:5-(carboxyamino)imidazole ribonucleotide synthase [Pusillimonas sp.]HUH87730.1 5-(carboxyamino)imidazole ribonucleotide synthase [Pusillimonas sp.]